MLVIIPTIDWRLLRCLSAALLKDRMAHCTGMYRGRREQLLIRAPGVKVRGLVPEGFLQLPDCVADVTHDLLQQVCRAQKPSGPAPRPGGSRPE